MKNETIRGLVEQYADYLTPEEVADILEVSVGAVYRRLQSGDLAGFQLGRQWRIPREEVEKFRRRSMS